MRIKLSDIDNLKLPKLLSNSVRVPSITVQCIVDSITCIISEYAINELHLDVTDETIYPYIKKYFEGEYRAKDLLKKLMSNYEISTFFEIIPDFENVGFNGEIWLEALKKVSILSTDKDNFYQVGDKNFKCKKSFFNIYEKEGKLFAQKLFKDSVDKKSYFSTLGNDEDTIDINNPFQFTEMASSTAIMDLPSITDEEFFYIDEIKSADENQRDAIRANIDNNLVILAGAGSGKTRTLVSRLAYLHLVRNIPLSKIVLLTFTKAAANEMQIKAERLIKNIYSKTNTIKLPYVYAKTFDAFFRKLVLDYYEEIGFTEKPRLELDQDDNSIEKKCELLKEVIEENQMQGIFSNFFQYNRNSLKDLLNATEDYAKGLMINLPGVDKLIELFLEKQIENNIVLDFLYVNLIIKKALNQEQSILKEKMTMRYSCVLIDEFQDISTLQNETLKVFYDSDMHFTFVGDDDQSIYAWRGSDVSIIQDIKNNQNTETKYLLTNYRNNPNIVRAGNCILRLIENRAKVGEIKPYKTSGSKIRVARSNDNYKNVVDEIDSLIKNGCEPKEISVLARKNKQVKCIIDSLEAINVPVVTQKVLINLKDKYYVMLKALINIHSDYELITSCLHIKQLAKDSNTTEFNIYKMMHGDKNCTGNLEVIQKISLEVFDQNATFLSTIVDRFSDKVGEVLERIVYGKLDNKTLEAFSDYCKDCEAPWPITQKQLKSIYLSFENINNKNRKLNKRMTNGVNVSTIHQAKGLEYNVVMIVGLNSGDYPDIGLIDSQYSKKVRELELLKNARSQFYELKNRISDVQIRSLISDCYNNAINQNIKENLYPLVLYIRGNQKRLRQLYTDAVDGFLETYNQHFIPLEKIFKFEQAKISKTISEYENVLEGKKEECFLINEKGNEEKYKLKLEECVSWEKAIESEKEKLNKSKDELEIFNKSLSNLKNFNKTCLIASGLLADMSRAEEIEVMKSKLEKERKIKIAEERRTFYVAVTRARDHLYLFTDENCNESEFISEIDDDLKTTYTALSKNERKEFERLTGGLRSEFKNIDMDEEIINSKIINIINDSHFKKHIALKLKEYYDTNPVFFALPKESRRYFEQGLSLIFVGELTGTDFSTEFAHNIQKSAECLLEYAAGDNAIPYTTNDYNLIDRIAKRIRRDAVICSTQIPTKRYIENIISISNNNNNRIDSLKKAGIEHYIVRSHNFKIDSKIYSSWKQKKINGDSQKFLKSVLDLSNIRNVLVHEKEDRWPEDAVTDILNNYKYIAKCCKIY